MFLQKFSPRLTQHIGVLNSKHTVTADTKGLHLGIKVPLHLAHLERRLPSLTSMLKAFSTSCSWSLLLVVRTQYAWSMYLVQHRGFRACCQQARQTLPLLPVLECCNNSLFDKAGTQQGKVDIQWAASMTSYLTEA